MILGLVLSAFIGVSLGLFGGGGSILTVPVLLYGFGLDTKEAIATSLLVVAVTSLAALVPHALANRVHWKTGALFGVSGMGGGLGGGILSSYFPADLLLVLFLLLMAATGTAMLRHRLPRQPAPAHRSIGKIVLDGALVGFATGLIGAGGGFLVVPALVLLGGLSMPVAIGTSLLVIALKASASLAGYITHVSIDATIAGLVTAAALGGGLLGALVARHIRPDRLKQGFGLFVIGTATFMAWLELPRIVAAEPLIAGVAATLLAVAGCAYALHQFAANNTRGGHES